MIDTIIWDLGGVLIDWKTTYVYDEHYFDSIEKRTQFFETVCTNDWNENQDAGYPIEQATAEKIAEFPQWESAIRDFYGRWEDMLRGPIHETVDIFRFLHWFDGRIVSGEEKTRKPFPKFYQILFDRYQIVPERSLFIDDNLRNVQAAEALNIPSIHFQDAVQLRGELAGRGVL
jgi:2-haloacid dehalogenase